MDAWVCAGWVLIKNSHMGVCLLLADQQLRHVCAGLVLISNGDMDVCLLVADQQWTHGLVLGWC